MVRGVALGGLIGLSLVACASAQSASDDNVGTSEVQSGFSVLDVSPTTSILPVVEARAGRLQVCLGLIGFGTETATASTKMQATIKSALSGWNALLVGNRDWSVATVAPMFDVQTTECSTTADDLRINVWKDAAKFTSDYCSRYPTWSCSSAGNTAARTVFIGPINRGVPDDVFDPYVILHEYGHMIGLGDTYRIAGSHDWVGPQPPSVMNRGSVTLTDDDKFGAWVTLRAVKTGVRSCTGFGAEETMTANVWRAIMCDPTATPTTTHGSVDSGAPHP